VYLSIHCQVSVNMTSIPFSMPPILDTAWYAKPKPGDPTKLAAVEAKFAAELDKFKLLSHPQPLPIGRRTANDDDSVSSIDDFPMDDVDVDADVGDADISDDWANDVDYGT
jgi:hypothetical protein